VVEVLEMKGDLSAEDAAEQQHAADGASRRR
jgi:hypothetical protein